MATPRKHWFRVADSVALEPWTNDELALAIRLMAHLNTRWAREGRSPEDAGSSTLSPGILCSLAGCASLVRARRILRALAEHVSLTVEERGVYTLVAWRKYAEFQRLMSEPGANTAPKLPPPQSAPARRKTQEEKEAASPPAPLVSRPPEAARAAPELPEAPRAPGQTNGHTNGHPTRASPRMTLMPNALEDAEWERLVRLTARHGLSEDQLKYACRTVHGWSHSKLTKRADWVLVVMNAIRGGWALRGY